MHPTQHSTHKRPIPRILRTHQLITQGVSTDAADTFIQTAAGNLQRLGKVAADKAPPLHIAPVRPDMRELLRRAGETVKTFTPVNPNNAA